MKKTTESKKNQAHSDQHKAVKFERRYFTPNNLKANNGQIDGVPANPRFIRDNKYKKLLESMQQDPDFLEIREIAVYDMGEGAATDERFVCIGGNMRYRAAKQLGWKTVPCKIIPTGYDKEKIRRFILKDNAAFGETDWDILINEFTQAEIDAAAIDIPDIPDPHMDEAEEAEEDNFDIDSNTPKVARSKDGDIYQLGEHRLICGDCTKPEYIKALMEGEQADLLVTDPPYNVDYSSKNEALNAIDEGNRIQKDIVNDKMTDANFLSFLTDAFTVANNNLRQGAAFYIWYPEIKWYNFRTAVKNVKWTVQQCLIWNKNNFVLGRRDYQWKHEPCLYGWKDGAAHYFVDKRNLSTVIEDKKDIDEMSKQEMKDLLERIFVKQELPTTVINCDKPLRSADHPTMKPVPLIGQLIANSSRRGDIVLDIFGGSGTTLIAAEQLGRKCRMMELEPVYIDVICKRWEELTGQTSELIGNIHDKNYKEDK